MGRDLGVGVTLGAGVVVGVALGVTLGPGVGVGVDVAVGDGLAVGDGVVAGVEVEVGVAVGVDVGVGVGLSGAGAIACMSLAIVHAGADDDSVVTNTVCRGRSIHRQVPTRVRRNEIGEAIGVRSVVKKRDGER